MYLTEHKLSFLVHLIIPFEILFKYSLDISNISRVMFKVVRFKVKYRPEMMRKLPVT